jgi:light-harvesting complex 1 beta chain
MQDDRPRSLSGLSEEEARGFHKMFMSSFAIFTVIAIIAHILVWNWRPWIPGVGGYQTSDAQPAAAAPALAANSTTAPTR